MMTIEEISASASEQLNQALSTDNGATFTVVMGDCLTGEPTEEDVTVSIECEIIFEYCNCTHKHSLVIGWNELDGVGLEYGEDCDITPITELSVMKEIYFDLALKNLHEKYML